MFNINKLKTGLDDALLHLNGDREIPGITNSMAFVSGPGSWFPWHLEEMNLGSINYMHVPNRAVPEFSDVPKGEKVWNFVAKYHLHAFESVMDNLLKASGYEVECSNYIMHRFLGLNPSILNAFGIDTFWYRQQEGQSIVTFPNCYHSGKVDNDKQ